MNSEKITLEEDAFGEKLGLGYRVRYRFQQYWCDVEVFAYAGAGEFAILNEFDSICGLTASLDNVKPEFTGYIKWDGCSEFDFGRPHWCGPPSYKKHFAILEHVYKRAQQLMENGNDDPWD